MDEILDQIKAARKAKNLTQKDIANALGVERSAYTNKETGRYPMTVEELLIVADMLDVTAAELLDGVPRPVPQDDFNIVCMADVA